MPDADGLRGVLGREPHVEHGSGVGADDSQGARVARVAGRVQAPLEHNRRLNTINEDGTLTYSFVEALEASHPGFVVRMLGGAIFLAGMFLMAYNTWRTVRAAKPAEYEAAAQIA